MARVLDHVVKSHGSGPDRAVPAATIWHVIRAIVASLVLVAGTMPWSLAPGMVLAHRAPSGVQAAAPGICDLFLWWPGCQ